MDKRERARQLAAEFAEKGDATGWFDALYREAKGDSEKIPWANLEPNPYLVKFAKQTNLRGNGRTALVVGCGLGDDAKYLQNLGFDVTAFDVSATAIDWARQINPEIKFEIVDLFDPPKAWSGAFDLVLEIYTIQPLPLGIRPQVIDAIAEFVAPNGKILIVARGREDDEIPPEMPWALSRKDLSQFEKNGLRETFFEEVWSDSEVPIRRFVIEYDRN